MRDSFGISLERVRALRIRLSEQLAELRTRGEAWNDPGFEEQIRQNMALFDRAMKMFTPFAFRADEVSTPLQKGGKTAGKPPAEEDELADLKAQMAAMQAQLKALAAKK